MPFRTWNQEIPKSKSYPGSKTQYPERSSCLEVLYLHPLTKFLTKKRVPAIVVYRNSEQVKTGVINEPYPAY